MAYCERGSLVDMLYGEKAVKLSSSKLNVSECGRAGVDAFNRWNSRFAFSLQSIALEASIGVKHLHAEKIVHRDIAGAERQRRRYYRRFVVCDLLLFSARNIFIDKDYTAKVGDFGMARDVGDDGNSATTATKVGPLKVRAADPR